MSDRPNVLLIMSDQLARRVLGCFGGPVPTPGLDRLCAEGVNFSQAITPYPLCSPARASIVTGLYPHAHGIVHNVMSQDYPMAARAPHDAGIRRADQTTEGLLFADGYRTAHFGKWHLSDEPLACYPRMYRETQEYPATMQERFAEARHSDGPVMQWYGWTLPVAVAPAVQERFAEEAATLGLSGSPLDEFTRKMGRLRWPEEAHFDYQVTSRAIRFLEDAATDDRPFMLTCSLNNPHDPNVVPNPYYDQFDPAAITLPATANSCGDHHLGCVSHRRAELLGPAGVREFLRIYYAQVAMVDRQALRLLETLRRCDLEEKTLVIFTSDHGDMAGSHAMTWKSTDAFYEDLVRMPLLMRWPGTLAPGEDARCANLVDLSATILDAAGVSPTRPTQGRSLLRSANAQAPYSIAERFRHDPATRRVTTEDPASIMIRTPAAKLVRYANGDEELFDLAADPAEAVNRAADPEMAAERGLLWRLLVAWMGATGHPQAGAFQMLTDAAGPGAEADHAS